MLYHIVSMFMVSTCPKQNARKFFNSRCNFAFRMCRSHKIIELSLYWEISQVFKQIDLCTWLLQFDDVLFMYICRHNILYHMHRESFRWNGRVLSGLDAMHEATCVWRSCFQGLASLVRHPDRSAVEIYSKWQMSAECLKIIWVCLPQRAREWSCTYNADLYYYTLH